MTKSTLDTIRDLLDTVARSLEPMSEYPDAATICGVEDRARITHARTALFTLAPPETPANPIQALRVALDYGMEREWPADLRALVARLLPEMHITTRWTGEGGDSIRSRLCATTGRLVVR